MSAHQWIIIAIMFAVTFGLRLTPFILRGAMKDSEFLDDLGALMPAGIMVILVVNSFAGVINDGLLAAIIGVAVTAALHLWKSHMTLSLIGGVGSYGLALAFLP